MPIQLHDDDVAMRRVPKSEESRSSQPFKAYWQTFRPCQAPGTTETTFSLFAHIHLVAQKFTGKQIKWEVVTRPAAGRRGGDHITGGGVGDVSLSLRAGRGDESLPLRVFWRSDAGMPLHAADDPALRFENLRAAAGPH